MFWENIFSAVSSAREWTEKSMGCRRSTTLSMLNMRGRRRRRLYVCMHFSHPISTTSYGNVHTLTSIGFKRTFKQSVSGSSHSRKHLGMLKYIATKALQRFRFCIDLLFENGTARQATNANVNRWCRTANPKATKMCSCVRVLRVPSTF